MTFRIYKGLTDILSLIFLFLGSFIILVMAENSDELPVSYNVGLSVFGCLLAAGITFTATALSDEGREGQRQVTEFLERNLNLEEPFDEGEAHESSRE